VLTYWSLIHLSFISFSSVLKFLINLVTRSTVLRGQAFSSQKSMILLIHTVLHASYKLLSLEEMLFNTTTQLLCSFADLRFLNQKMILGSLCRSRPHLRIFFLIRNMSYSRINPFSPPLLTLVVFH